MIPTAIKGSFSQSKMGQINGSHQKFGKLSTNYALPKASIQLIVVFLGTRVYFKKMLKSSIFSKYIKVYFKYFQFITVLQICSLISVHIRQLFRPAKNFSVNFLPNPRQTQPKKVKYRNKQTPARNDPNGHQRLNFPIQNGVKKWVTPKIL